MEYANTVHIISEQETVKRNFNSFILLITIMFNLMDFQIGNSSNIRNKPNWQTGNMKFEHNHGVQLLSVRNYSSNQYILRDCFHNSRHKGNFVQVRRANRRMFALDRFILELNANDFFDLFFWLQNIGVVFWRNILLFKNDDSWTRRDI